MIVLLFTTTPTDESVREEYDEIARVTRETAEQTPGFVGWTTYDGPGGETMGIIEFENEDALVAWRDHPAHVNANKRGREAVYGTYTVRVCSVMREASFDRARDASG